MKNAKKLALVSDLPPEKTLVENKNPFKVRHTKLQLVELLMRPVSEVAKIENVTKCNPETSVHDAVSILQSGNIGSIVITDGLRILGIFTERDFLLKCALKPIDLKTEPISNYMTPTPVCVQRHAAIGEVLVSMGIGKFRHIIVTDNYQNVESVLSMKDLVAYLVGSISEVI